MKFYSFKLGMKFVREDDLDYAISVQLGNQRVQEIVHCAGLSSSDDAYSAGEAEYDRLLNVSRASYAIT